MSEQNMNTDEEQITVTLTMEDDDEYDIAADAFDEWMDEQEFEEL